MLVTVGEVLELTTEFAEPDEKKGPILTRGPIAGRFSSLQK
jgi:hypothetical protein